MNSKNEQSRTWELIGRFWHALVASVESTKKPAKPEEAQQNDAPLFGDSPASNSDANRASLIATRRALVRAARRVPLAGVDFRPLIARFKLDSFEISILVSSWLSEVFGESGLRQGRDLLAAAVCSLPEKTSATKYLSASANLRASLLLRAEGTKDTLYEESYKVRADLPTYTAQVAQEARAGVQTYRTFKELLADTKRLQGLRKNLHTAAARERGESSIFDDEAIQHPRFLRQDIQRQWDTIRSRMTLGGEVVERWAAWCKTNQLRRAEQEIVLALLADLVVARSDGSLSACDLYRACTTPDQEFPFAEKYLGEESKLIASGLVTVSNGIFGSTTYKLQSAVANGLLGRVISTKADSCSVGTLIDPRVSLADVVLTAERRDRVDELLYMVRPGVAGPMPEAIRSPIRKNYFSALFHGKSGTGKTLLAHAIANELGAKLLIVEVERIFNKYVGDSEKGIASAFREARMLGDKVVLLFDECESLLESRGHSDGSVDRMHNAVVGIFLREIERHRGVVILASNLSEVLDSALDRRLDIKLRFDVPGVGERRLLWERHLVVGQTLESGVDLNELSTRFEIAGGSIRQAALAAARRSWLRANREKVPFVIRQADLIAAAQDEVSKTGRQESEQPVRLQVLAEWGQGRGTAAVASKPGRIGKTSGRVN